MDEPLFDTVAVNIEANTVRFFGRDKTYANAEAIVNMAVMRRGVDEEFYSVTPAGFYKAEGEQWRGDGGAVDPNPPRDPAAHIRIGNMSYPSGPRGL